jgi:uncharacterized protein YqgC (DUF456 family)
MENLPLIWKTIVSILVFFGIFMTFVPFLPGIFFMLLVSFIFAVVTGFNIVTVSEIGILGIIFLVALLNDTFSGIIGAKWGGASNKSVLAGLIGLVLGFFMLPPLGAIIGFFGGIFLSEIYLGKNKDKAIKAATGSIIGSAVGILINTILAISFFVLFMIFVWV